MTDLDEQAAKYVRDRRPAGQGRRLHPAGDHEVLLPARLEHQHYVNYPDRGYPDLGVISVKDGGK